MTKASTRSLAIMKATKTVIISRGYGNDQPKPKIINGEERLEFEIYEFKFTNAAPPQRMRT